MLSRYVEQLVASAEAAVEEVIGRRGKLLRILLQNITDVIFRKVFSAVSSLHVMLCLYFFLWLFRSLIQIKLLLGVILMAHS